MRHSRCSPQEMTFGFLVFHVCVKKQVWYSSCVCVGATPSLHHLIVPWRLGQRSPFLLGAWRRNSIKHQQLGWTWSPSVGRQMATFGVLIPWRLPPRKKGWPTVPLFLGCAPCDLLIPKEMAGSRNFGFLHTFPLRGPQKRPTQKLSASAASPMRCAGTSTRGSSGS